MFRIKICGVVQDSDIDDVAVAGADAVGLNFHPSSIRFVDPVRAAALSARASRFNLTKVGVFVTAGPEQIMATVDAVGLDFAQLHGNQTLADVQYLIRHGYRVIRVVRLPAGSLTAETLRRQLAPWLAVGCPLLLDAEVGDDGGGMGVRLDWDGVGQWARGEGRSATWALAGGLTAERVAEAIDKTAAARIDVASGVESPRGKKSPPKIAALVSAAQSAWAHRASEESRAV